MDQNTDREVTAKTVTSTDAAMSGRPYGPCERNSEGMCIGRCGRRGHLGRRLTIEEWLHFFGSAAVNARAKGGAR